MLVINFDYRNKKLFDTFACFVRYVKKTSGIKTEFTSEEEKKTIIEIMNKDYGIIFEEITRDDKSRNYRVTFLDSEDYLAFLLKYG